MVKQLSEHCQLQVWQQQNELVADEVFTGRPQNHQNIRLFDSEVSK